MTNPAPILRFVHGLNVDESVIESNVSSALDAIAELGLNNEGYKSLNILGGGPSALDGIRHKVTTYNPDAALWCLNNAWRIAVPFVGIDAVVIMDARPENIDFVDPKTNVEEWLIASQCHPSLWERLYDGYADVTIWHAAGPKIYDGSHIKTVPGGCTVLSRAINLGYMRGYRDFTLMGVDSSYNGGTHHAYTQSLNDAEKRIEVETPKGAKFITTPALADQATTVFAQMRNMERMGCTFHVIADGLLPTLWAEFKADFPNGEPND